MALTKTIVLQDNFGDDKSFPNAYVKVESVTASKSAASAEVSIYREKDGQFLARQRYPFSIDLTGDNFISQAYSALKELPEFSDAVDC